MEKATNACSSVAFFLNFQFVQKANFETVSPSWEGVGLRQRGLPQKQSIYIFDCDRSAAGESEVDRNAGVQINEWRERARGLLNMN